MALASVWMSLITLVIATVMALYRPAFTDLTVWLVLWLGAPASMCLAGMVLWNYRKETTPDPGLRYQRAQCKVAIVLAVVSAGIVYLLVMGAQPIPTGL